MEAKDYIYLGSLFIICTGFIARLWSDQRVHETTQRQTIKGFQAALIKVEAALDKAVITMEMMQREINDLRIETAQHNVQLDRLLEG